MARGSTLELGADGLNIGCAGARDGGRVTKVAVDARKKLARLSNNVLHDDVALGLLLAVSTGAVELAEIDDSEAVDCDGSCAVVLDDLVFCAGGATAGDSRIAVTFDRESVCVIVNMCNEQCADELTLADSRPPNVLNGTRTQAVNTLDLVGADNRVLERSSLREDENGVSIGTLYLTSARNATPVGLQTTIKDTGNLLSGI